VVFGGENGILNPLICSYFMGIKYVIEYFGLELSLAGAFILVVYIEKAKIFSWQSACDAGRITVESLLTTSIV
jgi:hypothetical protein